MILVDVAKEINEIIYNKQKETSLSFIEDSHTYFMKDKNGDIRSDFISVSTVIKSFYNKFIAENTQAFKNCNGDKIKEKELLDSWEAGGNYSASMGSRVHYILEQYLISKYGDYKKVRQPIFSCDEEQIIRGDNMVIAGKEYIDLMHSRGAVLVDTEIVLGDCELGYTGQPDKMWLINGNNGVPGIVITDWKTNKPNKMVSNQYTKKMLPPFTFLDDTALGHYNIQLPLYAKLVLKMLKGSKYENIKILGCIIVHLTDDRKYIEYRTPKNIINTILDMDLTQYVKELKI